MINVDCDVGAHGPVAEFVVGKSRQRVGDYPENGRPNTDHHKSICEYVDGEVASFCPSGDKKVEDGENGQHDHGADCVLPQVWPCQVVLARVHCLVA